MKRDVALLLLLSAFSAGRAWAQVPAGGEFQVNTYTSFGQTYPSVASDSAGNFFVVWTSQYEDGSLYGVFGQRYDATGAKRGEEFQVNSYTTSTQAAPEITSDSAGRFVVTWVGSFGVFGQRYDASGVPRGPEFQANTYTTGGKGRPRIAGDAAGNFVVVWPSWGQDDGLWPGVFAQRFDASGARRGSEFQVNTYTTGPQDWPSVAADLAGNFVVVWASRYQDGDWNNVFGQRYDASGVRRGSEFRVNSYTTDLQYMQAVASDPAGNFVVVWQSWGQDGYDSGVFGQRYDASGAKLGSEFQINTLTTRSQHFPKVAVDTAGNFIVAWEGVTPDGRFWGVFGQRYDASGARRGLEFQVNTYTTSAGLPAVASDAVGNFIVVWESDGQDGSYDGVFAQRFGGVVPAALGVDQTPSSGSNGNGVLEPGETVDVKPSWRNVNGVAQTFDGTGLGFAGPAASGVSYALPDAVGAYGTVADGATAACTDCYRVGVTFGGTRPSLHWDATFTERLTPDVLGQTKPWSVHVGESFADVPKTSAYYRFVETLLHKGVTAGCSATDYCPSNAVSREQMSVFTLEGREGAGYRPPACGPTPMFADVPASSFFCGWIEELARRGVVGGCGGGNYCPGAAVTREQMPVFVLRLLDPSLNPPVCGAPMFADVPASSPFCRWIEELARRGVVGGCGDGNYCPTSPVTREQMAVFITGTYGLSLYGP